MCIFCLFNAWTYQINVTFLLAWKRSTKFYNFIATEYHANVRCTSTQKRPVQWNTLNYYKVCGLYKGCLNRWNERKIWRTMPFMNRIQPKFCLKDRQLIFFSDLNSNKAIINTIKWSWFCWDTWKTIIVFSLIKKSI